MSDFLSVLSYETKRFFCKSKMVLVLPVFLLCLILVYTGLQSYKKANTAIDDFRALSRLKFEKMLNYNNYGLTGVKVLFIPGPTAILFHPVSPSSQWMGRVDTTAGLDIFSDAKGGALFKEDSPSPFSFSSVILLAGTLLAMFYGFWAPGGEEYNLFLASFLSPGRVFFYTTAARILLITLTLAALFGSVLLLYAAGGPGLAGADIKSLLIYLAASWSMLVFFFLVGFCIGRIPSPAKALVTLFVVWFVLVNFFPAAAGYFARIKGEEITAGSKVELEGFKIIADFEKRAKETGGAFDRKNIEEAGKIIESYWNNDYPKLVALETALREEIERHTRGYVNSCMFSPVTFYRVLGNEVSGKGFRGYLAFYGYLQELKAKFLRFFIDRCFYHDPAVMVNFIKGDENLFFAFSRVPDGTWKGMLISSGYIILFLFISFFVFKKSVYRIDAKMLGGREREDIRLTDHEVNVCIVEGKGFKYFLYTLFSGGGAKVRRAGYRGNVWVDEEDIAGEKKGDFVYIPHAKSLPRNLKVRHLLVLVCRLLRIPRQERKQLSGAAQLKPLLNKTFGRLDAVGAFQVLLELLGLTKCRYYLLDNTAKGLPAKYAGQLIDRMNQLNSGGRIVIYLTESVMVPEAPVGEGKWFEDGKAWWYLVKANRQAQESEAKCKQKRG